MAPEKKRGWYGGKPIPEGGIEGKCNAKTRSVTARAKLNYLCKKNAGDGTTHPGIGRCKHHGGSTINHVESAQKEMLRKAVATYGLPVTITPEEALLGELERTYGAVLWLQERIGQMDPEALVWGRHQAKQLGYRQLSDDAEELRAAIGTDLYEVTLQAGTSAWMQLYLKEREHLTKIAATAIKAGLEERKVNLAERQGSQLRTVLMAVFSELRLTDAQMRLVPVVLGNVLDRFTGGGFINGQLVPTPARVIES